MKYVIYHEHSKPPSQYIGHIAGEVDGKRWYRLSEAKVFITKKEAIDSMAKFFKRGLFKSNKELLRYYDVKIITYDQACIKEIIE